MDDTTCYINETFIECTNNSLSQNMMRSSQTLILGELSTVPTVQDDNCDEIDISPNQTDVSECQENVFQPLFESKCESLCDAPTDILRELSDTLLHFRTWNATDKDHEAASSILPIKDTSVSSAFFEKGSLNDNYVCDNASGVVNELTIPLKTEHLIEQIHQIEDQAVTIFQSCPPSPLPTRPSFSTESVLSVSQVLGNEHLLNDEDFVDDDLPHLFILPRRLSLVTKDTISHQERTEKTHLRQRNSLTMNSVVDGDLSKPNLAEVLSNFFCSSTMMICRKWLYVFKRFTLLG